MTQSDELEAFIEESLQRSSEKGYPATVFRRMRRDHGTVEAIERLVQTGDIQSGFKQLVKLNMREWTIEAAVLRFPGRFTKNAWDCAQFRLRIAQDARCKELATVRTLSVEGAPTDRGSRGRQAPWSAAFCTLASGHAKCPTSGTCFCEHHIRCSLLADTSRIARELWLSFTHEGVSGRSQKFGQENLPEGCMGPLAESASQGTLRRALSTTLFLLSSLVRRLIPRFER